MNEYYYFLKFYFFTWMWMIISLPKESMKTQQKKSNKPKKIFYDHNKMASQGFSIDTD